MPGQLVFANPKEGTAGTFVSQTRDVGPSRKEILAQYAFLRVPARSVWIFWKNAMISREKHNDDANMFPGAAYQRWPGPVAKLNFFKLPGAVFEVRDLQKKTLWHRIMNALEAGIGFRFARPYMMGKMCLGNTGTFTSARVVFIRIVVNGWVKKYCPDTFRVRCSRCDIASNERLI